METNDTRLLHTAHSPAQMWIDVAAQVRRWLTERGIEARDACVLLPFVELLAPAKRAFAAADGWLPRIHTTQTLSRELGPPPVQPEVGPSGDAAIDALLAARLLRAQAWGREWARRDAGAFEHAVSRVVRTAHVLMRGAQAVDPSARADYWHRVRLESAAGAGLDRGLLRAAVEWAALSGAAATDALFEHRPSAWIVVQYGGEDALARALLQQGHVPSLNVVLDAASADPFDALAVDGNVDVIEAADGEGEAMVAVVEVVAALERDAGPVALVAEDRALVRRTRALLERAGVRLDDETGWPLSTTRAGARVVAALRAAHPAASRDDLLDWLKSGAGRDADTQIPALEAMWRRGARDRDDGGRAQAWFERERSRLQRFAQPRRRTVSAWLQALDELVHGDDSAPWQDDAAVKQLRRALRLDDAGRAAAARAGLDTELALEGFTAWVQHCLEESRFVPESAATRAAVVITPLPRAIGRPFGTVVLPGADAQRLAIVDSPDLLLGDAALRALGLPDLAARRRRQALAFVHLLQAPCVTILRRRADGDEVLAPSPLIERLQRARQRAGRPVSERLADVPAVAVAAHATARPSPTVGGRLPRIWSASAVASLRQCPYQFFARVVLGLREDDELDDEVDKRDYGAWLHATLERFHAARQAPGSVVDDVERLARAGRDALDAIVAAGQADEAALLPYTAGFDAFARRYVAWLHGHEREGWRYEAGEVERTVVVDAESDGLGLRGRVDRIDRHATQAALHVIDYKTGAKDQLTRLVNQPLEDTQLAVYAALLQTSVPPGTALTAAYLALDDANGITEIAHPNVTDTARELVHALVHERQRMLAGAPLPALGQGLVCEFCEARGLCRRDHWLAAEAP